MWLRYLLYCSYVSSYVVGGVTCNAYIPEVWGYARAYDVCLDITNVTVHVLHITGKVFYALRHYMSCFKYRKVLTCILFMFTRLL